MPPPLPLQVASLPQGGDYMTCVYAGMPRGSIVRRPFRGRLYSGFTDVFHLNVPERLIAEGPRDERLYEAFIERVARSRVSVVWTVHNRRPHRGDAAWGERLYRAWARVADGLIHQSRWGAEIARSELPFRDGARHVVIPHGHFGPIMPQHAPRPRLERELGLTPCSIRYGVLGQPLATKRVEDIVRSFHACSRHDVQLLVTALTDDMSVPDDPRIHALPHTAWRERPEVARHVHVCDALVCAHAGASYLASGQPADAVGAGIPMLLGPFGFARETMRSAAWHFDDEEQLTSLFASLSPADIAAGKRAAAALQPEYDWTTISMRTLAFFHEVRRETAR